VIEYRLSERADRYERAIDTRLDERFEAVEPRLNERSGSYEIAVDARIDERLETHERRTDKYLLRRNMFSLARKTGAPILRYPKELYVD
jgi:hypothetical protein